MITNHYGVTVDSDIATTGVLNSNSLNWEFMDRFACLTCDDIYSDIESDETLSENEKDNERDFIECDSSHTRLIGDWTKDESGKYIPDKAGEFAAIENESTLQVVWSKYTAHGALCSPCYPGQVDLDSNGPYLGYALPSELI